MLSGDVLLVEDEAGIRLALASYLRLHGVRVREASTKAEGLAALAEAKPAALLCDEKLAQDSGVDVVRAFLLEASPRDVAICTADVRAPLRAFLAEHPAITCMHKPVAPRSLLEWLDARSAPSRAPRAAARDSAGPVLLPQARAAPSARTDPPPSAAQQIDALELDPSWRARVEGAIRAFESGEIESIARDEEWVRIVMYDPDMRSASALPAACEAWPMLRAGRVSVRVHRDPVARGAGSERGSERRSLWSSLASSLERSES